MRLSRLPLAIVFAAALTAPALADPVRVVAGENFWGDVASQIGGAHVAAESLLANPDQDPHLFEASTATAKSLAAARLAIVNGLDYDPWMEKLIGANKAPQRQTIVVGLLVGRKAGDNPHIWYNPAYVKAAAREISANLAAIDPANKADYEKGEANFRASLEPFEAKIADMRMRFAGQPISASEPVFGYQAELIGLKVHNEKFALAVMNNAEPAASEVAAFEDDLKGRRVKAMLFNAQASEPSVQRLVDIARASGVPVVGVTETEPPGTTYQAWMLDQLNALDKALSGPSH